MQAFVSLGMRHLVVVDAQNRIVGIITRKDLDHAAGHGWWRMSAQAPKPNRRPATRAGKGINKCVGSEPTGWPKTATSAVGSVPQPVVLLCRRMMSVGTPC